MTLPTSHPISLGQVCTEFGAPSNTALGAFVRGGAWVPNTPANSGTNISHAGGAGARGLLDCGGVFVSNIAVPFDENASYPAEFTHL